MSYYQQWQIERFGHALPESLPYNEHLEDHRNEEIKECLFPNMETGGNIPCEFLPEKETK